VAEAFDGSGGGSHPRVHSANLVDPTAPLGPNRMPRANLKRHYGRTVKSHAAAYAFTEQRAIVILPDVSAVDEGCATYTIRCDIPTLAAATNVVVGKWAGLGGSAPFSGGNFDCLTAFTNYSHGVCTSARISAELFPLQAPGFATGTAVDVAAPTDVYNAEASWYLSCEQQAGVHGTTEAQIVSNVTGHRLQRILNTKLGHTINGDGAPAGGCTLSSTYSPAAEFPETGGHDLFDNLGDGSASATTGGFSFLTSGNPATEPVTARQCSWTLTGVPRFPSATAPVGTTQGTVVTGRILPHRALIRIRWYCYMWNDFPEPVGDEGVVQPDHQGAPLYAAPGFVQQAGAAVATGLLGHAYHVHKRGRPG